MGTWKYRKPEPSDIRGLCVLCLNNKQKKKSNGKFSPLCSGCTKRLYEKYKSRKAHWKLKKCQCSLCGFKGHYSQFDIDHIDGNHNNNTLSNLQELCANCHRLKTFQNQDWKPSG